jgi:hypothetical protein
MKGGVMEVYKAIAAVQGEMAEIGIKKDKKNQQQGYNFRGIDDVYNALAPLLSKHGLCILPRATERVCVERQTKSGGVLFYTTVKCEFDFVSAVDGSKHTVVTYGEAMDSADKSTNKSMSSAYKYACFQAFCIPVDVEDADASHHEVKSTKMENKKDGALTWDELADYYQRLTGEIARTKPMDSIYEWAKTQSIFRLHSDGTLHLASTETDVPEDLGQPPKPSKATPAQKIKVRELMVKADIVDRTTQKDLYDYFMSEDTPQKADEFINKFDEILKYYLKAKERFDVTQPEQN